MARVAEFADSRPAGSIIRPRRERFAPSRQDENACKVSKNARRRKDPGILQLIFVRRGKRGRAMERSKGFTRRGRALRRWR